MAEYSSRAASVVLSIQYLPESLPISFSSPSSNSLWAPNSTWSNISDATWSKLCYVFLGSYFYLGPTKKWLVSAELIVVFDYASNWGLAFLPLPRFLLRFLLKPQQFSEEVLGIDNLAEYVDALTAPLPACSSAQADRCEELHLWPDPTPEAKQLLYYWLTTVLVVTFWQQVQHPVDEAALLDIFDKVRVYALEYFLYSIISWRCYILNGACELWLIWNYPLAAATVS